MADLLSEAPQHCPICNISRKKSHGSQHVPLKSPYNGSCRLGVSPSLTLDHQRAWLSLRHGGSGDPNEKISPGITLCCLPLPWAASPELPSSHSSRLKVRENEMRHFSVVPLGYTLWDPSLSCCSWGSSLCPGPFRPVTSDLQRSPDLDGNVEVRKAFC